jgi:hypothetical protein
VGKVRFIFGLALLAACSGRPTGAAEPEVRPFAPQYPLWTDGAEKRRFISLPAGATIDASDPDAWQLPVGTKLSKEFSFGGKKVETRTMERTADGWRFAAYVFSDDGKSATLAPERGTTVEAGGIRHRVPGQSDCKVCHGNGKTPVLGFSALQLSADRDPNAPHAGEVPKNALDLAALVRERRLKNFSGTTSPRLAARTPTARAAFVYLHANCGHCHRAAGARAPLAMKLADGDVVPSTVDRPSRIAPSRMRIARHAPEESVLIDRMKTREPAMQMPPLGTQLVDERGVALLIRWVGEL